MTTGLSRQVVQQYPQTGCVAYLVAVIKLLPQNLDFAFQHLDIGCSLKLCNAVLMAPAHDLTADVCSVGALHVNISQ